MLGVGTSLLREDLGVLLDDWTDLCLKDLRLTDTDFHRYKYERLIEADVFLCRNSYQIAFLAKGDRVPDSRADNAVLLCPLVESDILWLFLDLLCDFPINGVEAFLFDPLIQFFPEVIDHVQI